MDGVITDEKQQLATYKNLKKSCSQKFEFQIKRQVLFKAKQHVDRGSNTIQRLIDSVERNSVYCKEIVVNFTNIG